MIHVLMEYYFRLFPHLVFIEVLRSYNVKFVLSSLRTAYSLSVHNAVCFSFQLQVDWSISGGLHPFRFKDFEQFEFVQTFPAKSDLFPAGTSVQLQSVPTVLRMQDSGEGASFCG